MPVDAAGTAWDVWTGGGLGLSHNNPRTAALLAEYVGRVSRAQVVDVSRAIMLLQRDHGERGERKQARWKYTLRRLGIETVRKRLREEHRVALEDADPVPLASMAT